MAELPESFLPHKALLERRTGSGAYGDTYAPAQEVACFIEFRRRLVRTDKGEEVLSEASVRLLSSALAMSTPGCRITLHSNLQVLSQAPRLILTQAYHNDGGMGAWQHVEVAV